MPYGTFPTGKEDFPSGGGSGSGGGADENAQFVLWNDLVATANSRLLSDGSGSTVDRSTSGQVKINVRSSAFLPAGFANIPTMAGWIDVAISPDGAYVYVSGVLASNNHGAIAKVRVSDGAVVGTVDLGLNTQVPFSLAVSPNGSAVYALDRFDGATWWKIATANMTIAHVLTLAVPAINTSRQAFDLSPDGSIYAYVSGVDADLYMIDTATFVVTNVTMNNTPGNLSSVCFYNGSNTDVFVAHAASADVDWYDISGAHVTTRSTGADVPSAFNCMRSGPFSTNPTFFIADNGWTKSVIEANGNGTHNIILLDSPPTAIATNRLSGVATEASSDTCYIITANDYLYSLTYSKLTPIPLPISLSGSGPDIGLTGLAVSPSYAENLFTLSGFNRATVWSVIPNFGAPAPGLLGNLQTSDGFGNWTSAAPAAPNVGTATGTLAVTHGGTGLTTSGVDNTKALMSDGVNGFVMATPAGGGPPNVSTATGTLTVSHGGTGLTTLTSGRYLKGNGTGAVTLQALPIPVVDGGTGATSVTSGRYLKGNGVGALIQQAVPIPVTDGGTGVVSPTNGRILMGNGSSPISAITDAVLTTHIGTFTDTLNGSVPAPNNGLDVTTFLNAAGTWTVPPGGGGTPAFYNTSGNYRINNDPVLFLPFGDTDSLAIGRNAGSSQSATSRNNTYVGTDAGKQVTTGSFNVFVGGIAGGLGATPLTGSENTAVGYGALLFAQGGASQNTCIGSQAGESITTGSQNTCIGNNVGEVVLTTGSGNVFIGTSQAIDGNTTNTFKLGAGGGTEFMTTTGCDMPNTSQTTMLGHFAVAGNFSLASAAPAPRCGRVTLAGGVATINTTAVTANSIIQVTGEGGTLTNASTPYHNKANLVAGTSFEIKSLNPLDTQNVSWVMVEPLP